MGAFEGAAITVLAKGLENFTFGETGTTCDAEGNGGCVTLNNCTGTAYVDAATNSFSCTATFTGATAQPGDCNTSSFFHTSNFQCNPSRIDGLTLTNSSQGGGALFVHGWNHYLEISNNRMTGNAGTLTGGITLGQAEVPDPTVGGALCNTLAAPFAAKGLTIGATDTLARLFTIDFGPLATLRGLALTALEFVPPVKAALARQMMFGQRS